MEYLDIEEFINDGYLQEVNRQFLHPLGLALAVSRTETGEYSLYGIQSTDDPEGIVFDEAISASNARTVETEALRRAEIRRKTLGFVIQPIRK